MYAKKSRSNEDDSVAKVAFNLAGTRSYQISVMSGTRVFSRAGHLCASSFAELRSLQGLRMRYCLMAYFDPCSRSAVFGMDNRSSCNP